MKIFLFLMFGYITLNAHNITGYKTIQKCYLDKNAHVQVALREFDMDGNSTVWSVDAATLETRLDNSRQSYLEKCSISEYSQLLDKSISKPFPMQNDGITSNENGIVITTDLCPSSKKGFEKQLYLDLMKKFKKPVPVTLFVTGRWIDKHLASFKQFQKWQDDGNMSVTWGNHTYTHPYHPSKPLSENFALSKDYNLTKDTLMLEQKLLSEGVIPSIFFRFPGLVSDKKSMIDIGNLGLVTIGSNTWLAKNQKIKKNSIILLHGNKNEHKGVVMFEKLLDANSSMLMKLGTLTRKDRKNYMTIEKGDLKLIFCVP